MRVSNHAPVQPYRPSTHPRDGNGHPVYSLPAVLDHLLVDVISSIRRSFDQALLQRQAVEERSQVDVFLGDVSWETSYSLPGEQQPPRVRADVSVDWPTWSQTSYRSWNIGEPPDELPEVVIEVALRIQRLAVAPDTETVLAALPEENPLLGTEPLGRSALQRAPARRPRGDHAGDRRSDPMDRVHPHPSGRSALFVSPARRGR